MFEGDPGLRVGTSSWSSKDWSGVFYPPELPSNRYIEHYATVYDSVEIDATFYGVPDVSTVHAWRARTPDGFRFAAKVPRTVTHEKTLVDAEGDMEQFLDTMAELGDRLGPLLLQFPYFNKKAFESKGPFLERLDAFLGGLPAEFRYVVEVRNKWWIGRDLHEVCQRHRVALAWVHQAWMPSAREWQKRLGTTSTNFAYFRFLGDHKAIEEITRTWDKPVVDRTRELERWVPIIQDLRAARLPAYVFFNNHFAGHAPATIELFREVWKQAIGMEDPDAE